MAYKFGVTQEKFLSVWGNGDRKPLGLFVASPERDYRLDANCVEDNTSTAVRQKGA